jgi:hypothetical protein
MTERSTDLYDHVVDDRHILERLLCALGSSDDLNEATREVIRQQGMLLCERAPNQASQHGGGRTTSGMQQAVGALLYVCGVKRRVV